MKRLGVLFSFFFFGLTVNLFAQYNAYEEQLVSDSQRQAWLEKKLAQEQIYLNEKENMGIGITPMADQTDCIGATPICQNFYSQPPPPTGSGPINDMLVNNTCLSSGEKNGVWYTFTVQQSGTFGFVINTVPQPQIDYDFALWNVTNATCSDIQNGFMPIRCNYSANAVPTGLNSNNVASQAYIGVGAGGNAVMEGINVVAGETYMLLVSRFAADFKGYSIDFSGTFGSGPAPSAVLFDSTAPVLLRAVHKCPPSNPRTMILTFSEPIKCQNLTLNVGFNVSHPLPTGTCNITNVACGPQNFEDNIVITYDAIPDVGGDFPITVIGAIYDKCSYAFNGPYTIPTGWPTITATGTDINCFGGLDGTIIVNGSAASGSTVVNYTLTGPNGTVVNTNPNPTFTGLGAGTYTVEIKSNDQCTEKTTVVINQPPSPVVLTATSTNILCNGAGTGAINATGSGGTGALTYSLSGPIVVNSQPTGDFTNLPPGTYTVTVKDTKGCQKTQTLTITEPPVLTTQILNQTNVQCSGQAVGAVTIGAGGGKAPYTFVINTTPPQSNSTGAYTGLVDGTYDVTVTDANGCVKTQSVTITVLTNLQLNVSNVVGASCNGGADGSFLASASGGPAPFTYQIIAPITSAQNSTGSFNGLAANTYTVLVKDGSGCGKQVDVVVPEAGALNISLGAQTNIKCTGGNNGAINLSANGGTSGYSFSIGQGSPNSSGNFTNLSAGTYNCSVTDVKGCQAFITVTLTEPPVLSLTANNVIPVSCFGTATGGFDLVGAGGTPPYQYGVSTSPTLGGYVPINTFPNLTAGTYHIFIRDINLCTFQTTVVITQPPVLDVTVLNKKNIKCAGAADGLVTLAATGGSSPYQFKINGGAFGSSPAFNGLIPGNYKGYVKDLNGCVDSVAFTITQPTPVVITLDNVTPETCLGKGDGCVHVSASGGSGNLLFTLTPGNIQNVSGDFCQLAAGTYTIKVTDDSLCFSTLTATITSPAPVTLTAFKKDLRCNNSNDGGVFLQAAGGNGIFQYANASNLLFQPQPFFTNLAAGAYIFVVRDGNNCEKSVNVNINQPTPITLAVGQQTNVDCKGASTGSITLAASGGSPAYQYSKDFGPKQSSPTFGGLAAGIYSFAVFDDSLCTKTITATITEPDLLTIFTVAINPPGCSGANDGSITVGASGGAGGYQFSSDDIVYNPSPNFTGLVPGNYTYYVKDANGCKTNFTINLPNVPPLVINGVQTTPAICFGEANGSVTIDANGGAGGLTYSVGGAFQTNSQFVGLTAGNYTASVKDMNGCVKTFPFVINQPTKLVIVGLTLQNVSCNGANDGQASVTPSGGTAPYCFILDSNPCTTNQLICDPGSHTVRVVDGNGCFVDTTFVITEPAALAVAPLTGGTICVGQPFNFNAVATNIVGAVTYTWTDVSNNAVVSSVSNPTFNPSVTTTYKLTVTDACFTRVQTVSVNVIPADLAITSFSISTPTLVCPSTLVTATVSVSGGTGNYTYNWNVGGNSNVATKVINSTNTLISVTITDGCYSVDTSIVVNMYPVVQVGAGVDQSICVNNSAILNAAASGGDNNFVSYEWKANGISVGSLADITVSPSQTTNYIVTVTDGCGQTATDLVQVVVRPRPVIEAGANAYVCRGDVAQLSGSINLSNNCSVEWSPTIGLSNPFSLQTSVQVLTTTTYTLSSSCDGCAGVSDTVTVFVRPKPAAFFLKTNLDMCADDPDGVQIQGVAMGGSGSLTSVWSPTTGLLSSNSPNVTAKPSVTTTYTYTAIDSLGCQTDPIEVKVTVHEAPTANAGADKALCQNSAQGVTLDGGVVGIDVGHAYQWSPATGLNNPFVKNPIATPSVTTTYTLQVTSLPWNCVGSTDVVTVTVNPLPIVDAGPNQTICFEDQIQIGTIPQNITPTTTVQWSPTIGLDNPNTFQPNASPPHTQKYLMVVTTAGCASVADSAIVFVRPKPTVSVDYSGIICPGETVQLSSAVNGAPGPYQYAWSPSAGLSNANIPNPTATVNQTTTYTLSVVADGCTGATTDEVTVTVRQIPTVDANPNGNPRICLGQSTQLGATITGGEQPIIYSWSPAVGLSNPNILNPVATPPVAMTYTLTVSSGLCVLSDSVSISLVPFPDAEIIASDTLICKGSSVTLRAFGGSPTARYEWSPQVGTTQTDGREITVTPPQTTTYTVIVSEQGLCTDATTVTVSILPTAEADFMLTNPVNCNDLNVSFRNLSQNAVGYIWDFGDGSPVTNEFEPRHRYNQSGEYLVTLRAYAEGGCGDTVSASAPIVVSTGLSADFTSVPKEGSELILPETRVEFTADAPGAVSYFWDFGDELGSSAEQNPVYVYPKAGVYEVKLTVVDAVGCVVQVKHGNYTIVQPDLNIPNVFTPNDDGSNDSWNVEYNGTYELSAKIFDRWGNLLFTQTGRKISWDGKDARGQTISSGAYFYQLELNKRLYKGTVTLVR